IALASIAGRESVVRGKRDDNSTSRRRFLKSSASLLAGATAVAAVPQTARAQALDDELRRVQASPRILLKGAIVLSLDAQVGDFANADVLIEDGRIAQIRPGIAISDNAAAIVDASDRIIIPGFIDTHVHSYQGL